MKKIALFVPDSVYAAWSLTEGLSNTLQRMGQWVYTVRVPQTGRLTPEALPTLDFLKRFDAVVLSGPEHLAPYLEAQYGRQVWTRLDLPVLGWYHESNDRDDRHFGFEHLDWTCTKHFFPAEQDAGELEGTWLPFGVDTQLFSPWTTEKKHDLAFIGLLYAKRKEYLGQLLPKLKTPLTMGNCVVQDLSGVRLQESAQLYVENVRQTKVFLNLPSLSRLTVTKVYEVAACGTLCVTPIPQGSKNNWMDVPAVFYDPNDVNELATYLEVILRDEEGREKNAKDYCLQALQQHSLSKRCEVLLRGMS